MTSFQKIMILGAATVTSVLHASEWQLKLQSVIRSSDPGASVAIENGVYVYRHHTQTFKVHTLDKTGLISEDAHDEEGPNVDGILLNISLQEGPYEGAADLPQELKKPYWTTFLNAYPTDGDKHLLLNLSYGSRADKKLIEAIKACLGPLQVTPAISTAISNGVTKDNRTIDFGGVQWLPWRTLFEIQGRKLVSLPKARPGFNYGHGGNGRSPTLITNIGNPDWRNYSVRLTLGIAGVDPKFNPHCLPADYRGASISFHIADAKESWNERGSSNYSLGINADGSWGLSCVYNCYSPSRIGWFTPKIDGQRSLAQGKGIKVDQTNGNRFRIDVAGQRIQIWADDEKIADVTDAKMTEEIGGITLDHGGVAVSGGFDCMIWISDFSMKPL
jgi:hypothetical protein